MTVKMHGSDYVTVAERVAAAHDEAGADFEVVGGDIITIGKTERWWYQATIRVRGRLYVGTSEIKFNAKAGTADAQAPVECAETSAIGRALGFAGFGAADSIASADEMQRAGSTPPPSHERSSGTHSRVKFNALSDMEFRQRCNVIGYRTVAQVEELLAAKRLTVETATREQAFMALIEQEQKAREAQETTQHSLDLRERTATK